jgi:FkbM family methyltransferase
MSRARIIRAVGRVPGVARALRWVANRYAEGSVVTIPTGYAQGMRWRRSHAYVNGFWVGQHELDVQAAIARILSPGDGFIDLGANAGFFTLVGAKRVGPGGWCVAVDPDPFNCESIRAQAEVNALKNCAVLQQAVAEQAGRLRFKIAAPGDSTGHLAGDAEAGATEVEANTLDAICETHGRPALVKVDVEGAEVRVLQGARRTIHDLRPAWLLEMHGDDLSRECRRILSAANYRFTTLAGEPLPESDHLPYHSVAVPN